MKPKELPAPLSADANYPDNPQQGTSPMRQVLDAWSFPVRPQNGGAFNLTWFFPEDIAAAGLKHGPSGKNYYIVKAAVRDLDLCPHYITTRKKG